MPTVSVNLSTTEYVQINSGLNPLLLQSHRDDVRVVLSSVKPAKTNGVYHTLGGDDDLLKFDSIDTNVWVLATTDNCSLVVSETDAVPVDPQLNKTAFGELLTGELMPQVNVDFSYTLHPEIVSTRLNNGSASVDQNRVKLSTGAAADQSANLLTKHSIKYHAGLGVAVRFTGVFTAGVAGSTQTIGVGDSGDGFFFGYDGSTFGVLRRKGGSPEIRSLQITAKSTTAENITITLDGIAVSVAVSDATAGDETTTANDIAIHDFSNTGAGWQAVPNGDTVNFISFCASPYVGTFSLSGATTAAGTFTTKLAGIVPTNTWIPQVNWSVDTFDGNGVSGVTLDPTKGNVFQIKFQWLGYGQISFYIENPFTGGLDLVHTIDYANTDVLPSINNPTLPMCAAVENDTNTTDIVLYSSSMSAFTEGRPAEPDVHHVHIVDVTFSSTTLVPAITLHNNGAFAGKLNRVRMKITNISVEVESGKPVLIEIIRDATLTGASFNDHNAGESVALIDTVASALSNGEIVGAFSVSSGNDKEKTPNHGDIEPTEFITIAGAQATTGTNSVAKIIVEWSEDF